MKKISRNDKCHCGSQKKYKQCCLTNDEIKKQIQIEKYKTGQLISSKKIIDCMDYLKGKYPDHKIIDISDNLDNSNYKTYQINNYTDKIIMISEKNDKNKDVIMSRSQSMTDTIIMYRGSYRVFLINDFELVKNSICKMIDTRLSGLEDK